MMVDAVPGVFITVEGSEGSGKTTNIAHVRAYLEAAGRDVLLTREPGGTSLGEQLRGLLLDHRQAAMSVETELLLMIAARAQHLEEVIRPALAAGRWVLCDRFTDASYAYQGAGRGMEPERIAVLEHWVQRGLRPDLTLLLDIPVEIGLQRASARGEPDRFECEVVAFFERVREGYLARAEAEPDRFRVIDAGRPPEDVQQQIESVLERWLHERFRNQMES